jgi:hypothetical protein
MTLPETNSASTPLLLIEDERGITELVRSVLERNGCRCLHSVGRGSLTIACDP